MEPFIGQWIWTISKWHWRQNEEPHQHHQVHQEPSQGTKRAKARCYVWAICMHSMTQKGWTQSNTITVGGDRINYPGEVATPTVEMLVAKMLFNSIISTKGARFMTMDISNFYLMTPLHRPEFIQMKLSDIPDKVIKEYKLREKATPDGSIYIEPSKACAACCNQVYWQMNSLKNNWTNTIQTEQIGTRPLETRHTANTIHIGCWQLWSKILWWGTRQSSQTGSGQTLQTHLWLDGNTIHWHCIRLELTQNARYICQCQTMWQKH